MQITLNMDEERYNNRQIERMLDSQSQELKDYFDKSLKPLIEQVTKTNGRVSTLELRRENQAGFNRAMAVASSVGFTVVMALAGWALYQVASLEPTIHTEVQQSVKDALSSYDVQVVK